MSSNFKDIYIGKLIQDKVDEKHLSYAEFARQIHCARTSLYHIFKSKNIDVERLLLISEVLQYDFIEEVYRRGRASNPTYDSQRPYVMLPFKNNHFDLSHLPHPLCDMLRNELHKE